jgi:hypothetical protein
MMTEQLKNETYVNGFNIIVNGEAYPLITSGRKQAIQVQGITRWASVYGASILSDLQAQGEEDAEQGLDFLVKLLGHLSADAMIDLFQAISGCTQEEAELYFDAAVLIDAGIVVYENHPTVRRLLDRFFSTSDSEQEGQPESSTTSE